MTKKTTVRIANSPAVAPPTVGSDIPVNEPAARAVPAPALGQEAAPERTDHRARQDAGGDELLEAVAERELVGDLQGPLQVLD